MCTSHLISVMSRKIRIAVAGCALGLACTLLVLWSASSGGDWLADEDMRTTDAPDDFTLRSIPGSFSVRLRQTILLNGEEVYEQLGLTGRESQQRRAGFLTHSPYVPRYRESNVSRAALNYPLPPNKLSYELDEADSTFEFYGQEAILRWYSAMDSNTDVCGAAFVDSSQVEYRLRSFTNAESAHAAGYFITHRNRCGTCSSLRDLAVYLAQPNLTAPARTCARRLTPAGVKACLIEKIGFEERCAETWTFNVLHTRRHCTLTCIKHYGLWNVLRNDMNDMDKDERGNLNPCLACDEFISGPGFQYVAGRTRRNSGIVSSIQRSPEEIYEIDHSLYFR